MIFPHVKFLASRWYIYLILSTSVLSAQSNNILHGLEKLNTLGSVLYIAAHPDDENTRLISYFSNHDHVKTVYLSLTRGDGGQNLIGPELRQSLGLLRTHELLQARSIDGGEQFFTRANDFGYSKSPEETMRIWDKQEVLADVVWAIRVNRPDIIVNRFSHIHNGRTHGHHTASAMLSYEAFELAGDSTAFREQLEYVETWQPRRIYFNTSYWFYGSREEFSKADKSMMAELDVGQYYPLLGLSNNEISGKSRSMHKCQGFGSALKRGVYYEYLLYLKGDKPNNKNAVFDDIDITWNRLPNGKTVEAILNSVIATYNPKSPVESISGLLKARKAINNVKDDFWRKQKLKEIDQLILQSAGVHVQASTSTPTISKNETIKWTLEIINRSDFPIEMHSILSPALSVDSSFTINLSYNLPHLFNFNTQLRSVPTTTPYWLLEKGNQGMLKVSNQKLRGKPLEESKLQVATQLMIGEHLLDIQVPLKFVRVDPVAGELTDPVRVVPEIHLTFTQENIIFKPNETKKLILEVNSQSNIENAHLQFKNTNGWLIQLDEKEFSLQNGLPKSVSMEVTAPGLPDKVDLKAFILTQNDTFSTKITTIQYDHIPDDQIEESCIVQLICIAIKTVGSKIGYVQGAGDKVDIALNQIGFDVETIDPEKMNLNDLQKFDAILLGIRAFNTNQALSDHCNILFEYVYKGGNLIVQYNTRHRLKTKNIAPYSIQLSRKRVTDEYAKVSILEPDHPGLNFPNLIRNDDFEGWVQERGLYFPDDWAENFKPLLEMSDPGEGKLQGALLVAKYGEGYYVYSSLSYFRQLPAGVPGAYKLLSNLIALGKSK